MSSRRNHTANSKQCTCNLCLVQAVSTPGTRHRRCGGTADAAPRKKHDNLPSANRGVWE